MTLLTKIFGISILGWVNRLFFQWFFIRLGYRLGDHKLVIMKWIVPLTGWKTDYIPE